MTCFTYKAKSGPSKIVEGTLEAETMREAIARIIDLGYDPVDVLPERQTSVARQGSKIALNLPRMISQSEKVFFMRQLSDLINAGVPVLRSLTLAGQQIRNPRLKELTVKMVQYVRDGGNLSGAMGLYPKVFPRLYCNLVKAGETGGRLADVLNRLADLAQRELDTRGQVIASLVYPSVIMVVGTGTIFVLLTWVVPRLTAIFNDWNEALPLPTVILLGISDFLSRFWWLIIIALIIGIVYFKRLISTEQGRVKFDALLLKLPLFGYLVRAVEIGRFSRTMATLLGNGVTIVTALESTAMVMSNIVVRKEIERMIDAVRGGSSLNGILRKSSIFPEAVVTMVAVGEESGHLHSGLERMADHFERETARYTKIITTLMEPLLIFAMGIVVGFVVLAMLMPLLRMNMIIH